jgi:hypothetical protein
MSFEAMAMVVTVENISPINKLVLILLSNYADQNSKCFPSYEKIAKLANCSRRTAVRSINTLNKLGLIDIERRKLSNNDNQSNIYTINRPSVTMSPASDKDSINPSDTITPPSDTMSPNTITLNNQLVNTHIHRFEDFWQVFPKKRNIKGAKAKWNLKKLDSIADEIIADVLLRITDDRRWVDGFIPDPLTYINQERWNDEVEKLVIQPPTKGTFDNKSNIEKAALAMRLDNQRRLG